MKQNIKTSGYISLLLLLPAPTIGVIAGMYLWPGPMGQLIWSASKLWMILLPLMWLIMIDRGSVSLSPMKRGGWLAGLVSGLIIFIAILITYYLFGRRWIDTQYVCQMMIDLGLSSR